ncbi:16S rRNA (adenine(1518)-N(6)/adenine(1519)-N(6))-dimethyltransferase RsmA [Candidatus Dependentiae bacterium]
MAKRPKTVENCDVPAKKKAFGQHFLRDNSVVENMIKRVDVENGYNVLEIGCGDGFLTRAILEQGSCKKLLCFEIDPEWYEFVRKTVRDRDTRLDIRLENVLDFDWRNLEKFQPLVMLANLPYQITFPILYRIQQCKGLFKEGVVMIQEEVAQKIVAGSGRNYGYVSLFLQHNFELELLDRIAPEAFEPPPKVYSRLLYFKPRFDALEIKNEAKFWKFVKICFASPRKTLKNNLLAAGFDISLFSGELLALRAQQMNFDDFLVIWDKLNQR